MATRIQRAKNLLDALSDGDIDNAIMLRIANAFAVAYEPEFELNNTQKAGVILREVRNYVRGVLRDSELAQEYQAIRSEKIPDVNSIELGSDGAE